MYRFDNKNKFSVLNSKNSCSTQYIDYTAIIYLPSNQLWLKKVE